jgi:hypothetical protein
MLDETAEGSSDEEGDLLVGKIFTLKCKLDFLGSPVIT